MSAISLSSLANVPTSSTTSPNQKTNLQDYFKKRTAEVEQLSQALKSGDLAAAEQDYNNIVALGNKFIHRDNPFFRSDRGLDFNAIGGALQNGDLAGARQALAALENTYRLPPASPASAPSSSLKSGVDVVA